MKYKNHSLRHELKYVISYNDYVLFKSRLSVFTETDKNSGGDGYFIRSLYFDDIHNSAYNEKEAGINRRRKFRIRTYNYSPDVIKFEIKDKFDSFISKQAAAVSKGQFYKILDGDLDFLIESDNAVLREIYISFRTKLLKPSVIVDYDREAFICEEGNVRITFDKNLSAGIGSFDIFDEDILSISAFEPGYMILEIKYDDYLPEKIKRLLSGLNRWQTAQSKFVMCKNASSIYYRKEIPYDNL